MNRTRPIAWTIAAVAVGTLAFSSIRMAERVSAFHRANPRQIYAFKAVTVQKFNYAGKPVTLTDEDDASGTWHFVVRYGEDELKLRVTIPGDRRLPGLLPHEDWLRVLRFAEATGSSLDELRAKMESGQVADRLAIVTRTPTIGSDPGSWGELDRKAWKFDFYEFKPAGGFDHERKSFPVKQRIKFSGDKAGQVPTQPEDELKENTWEYQAALMVMPPARGPNPQFTNDGLHAMGWTLPVTSTSMLALIGSLMIALAPRRK